MKPEVICAACNERNEFGRVFCISCGEKLDSSTAEMQRVPPSHSPLQTIIRLSGLLLSMLGVVALALIAWPASRTGARGEHAEAIVCYRKIVLLDHAIRKRKATTVELWERELNAYLEELVERPQENGSEAAGAVEIHDINVDFRQDHCMIIIRAGWGPLRFSYGLKGVPGAGDSRWGMRIQAGRLGHLPLPRSIASSIARTLTRIFTPLKRERFVLSYIDTYMLDEHKATLVVKGEHKNAL